MTEPLNQALANAIEYLPTLLGALAVLVVGYVVGRILGGIVTRAVRRIRIERYTDGTAAEQVGGGEGLAYALGKVVAYYVYLLTLLTVADILDIDALTTPLNGFAAYLPALVAGLLVLLVGIWLAEHVADAVHGSGDGRAVRLAAVAVKLLVYYLTVTIALATVGIETAVLTGLFSAFVVAFFGALAVALALGIGLAVGLGGQNYVEENIGDWVESVKGNVVQSDAHADGDRLDSDRTSDDFTNRTDEFGDDERTGE